MTHQLMVRHILIKGKTFRISVEKNAPVIWLRGRKNYGTHPDYNDDNIFGVDSGIISTCCLPRDPYSVTSCRR